jgi:cytochrome c
LRVLIASAAATAIACVAAAQPAPRASAGERAYQKCYSCHALEPGKNDLDGPTLHGIIGRRIAAEPGFEYSSAMRSFAGKHERWTVGLIDRFAADPETLVPGTTMTFTGMRDARERSALIAYLQQISVGKPAAR